MKVLIAGCGYVGCALAELLVAVGHNVSGLRRNPSPLPRGVVPLRVDLADPESVRVCLRGAKFDWVVYAAAAGARDEAAYRRAYIEGLSHVLDVIEVPARLVFTSSTAVYGQSAGERVDEMSPTAPTRFSGEIMLEAEEIVESYSGRGTSIRFGGIYGPTRTRLIDGVRHGTIELPSGPQLTNRIHRDDCARAIAHLLKLPDPTGLYVGVDDDPADMADVLRWMAERLGVKDLATSVGPPPARGKRCSNARLVATGFSFRYPTFREGYAPLL